MGIAVIFVMGIASVVTYGLNLLRCYCGHRVPEDYGFILVIAAPYQILEVVLKKFMPSLYSARWACTCRL